ncbi:MAG: hypothetical protein GC155_02400 [Alphaproteobacteria bacterium]|nr:hypothetical protein [Alphaproteobacteria bacterium]
MTSSRYDRPSTRALAVEREGFHNWLYFARRSRGAFDHRASKRREKSGWRSTALARFFGMPDVLYYD